MSARRGANDARRSVLLLTGDGGLGSAVRQELEEYVVRRRAELGD